MNGLPLFDFASGIATVPGCTAEPCAGSVAPGPGLSKGHTVTVGSPPIKDLNSYLHVWEGAGLLRVKNPYTGDFDPTDKDGERVIAKRGEIKGHSTKSQSRARQFLAKIPNEAIMGGLLVTLTYPGTQAADKVPDATEYLIYKEHLRRFNQSIVRVWKGCGAWFLEFQTRGAPHYHHIVFGVPHSDIEAFQVWVSAEWNRIVEGGADHLKAGTRVEIPKNCQAARNYVTAYFTKGSQALEETKVGRYWGKFGTASIPLSPEAVETLTPIQAKIATRTARRSVEHRAWSSAWNRLHRRAGKAIPSMTDLTTLQFRTLCENCRRGKVTGFVNSSGMRATYTSHYLEVIALVLGVARFKFPRRYRCRNNSTINLYCDASQFGEALKRHPRWNEVEKKTDESPLSLNDALRSYADLIPELKAAYLSADTELVGIVLGKLGESGKVLGFQFDEGWNDVTKTLFVSVRSGAGKVLLDIEL